MYYLSDCPLSFLDSDLNLICTQYTVKNLLFSSIVEPDNVRISQKLSWAQQKRAKGLPTIPSTIEEELETNLFMRVDLPEVQVSYYC